MDLDTQLEKKQQALSELLADQQEMERLLKEATAKVEQVRGSKNFSGIADAEAKRAALSSMLNEQRGYVAQAENEIQSIRDQMERAAQRDALRTRLLELGGHKEKLDKAFRKLLTDFRTDLAAVLTSQQLWDRQLETLREEVATAYDLPPMHQLRAYDQSVDGGQKQAAWKVALADLGDAQRFILQEARGSELQVGTGWRYERPGYLGEVIESQAYQRAMKTAVADLFEPSLAVALTEVMVASLGEAQRWQRGRQRHIQMIPYAPQGAPEQDAPRGGHISMTDYEM